MPSAQAHGAGMVNLSSPEVRSPPTNQAPSGAFLLPTPFLFTINHLSEKS